MSFKIDDDWLNFDLENNFAEPENFDRKNSGIGISNVKQRLKHLYNTKDYQLEVKEENYTYSVHLRLKLRDNGN